jgi:hypothetical protein
MLDTESLGSCIRESLSSSGRRSGDVEVDEEVSEVEFRRVRVRERDCLVAAGNIDEDAMLGPRCMILSRGLLLWSQADAKHKEWRAATSLNRTRGLRGL